MKWCTGCFGRWQAFKDESGRPSTMTGVNIDITERQKRLEREIVEASDSEMRRNRARFLHDGGGPAIDRARVVQRQACNPRYNNRPNRNLSCPSKKFGTEPPRELSGKNPACPLTWIGPESSFERGRRYPGPRQ